jgi:CRP/FNR family transcriptional regulator
VGTPSIYRKCSSIFFQGEIPRQAVVILDGVVKAYTISPDGDESIVNLYSKGSVIPVAWVSDQSSVALFNYDAVNDVRVLKVNKNDFAEAINNNPQLQKEYLDHTLQSKAGLMLRITGLVQARASSKICYTLYFLMFRYGIERSPGVYEIDLKITQSMLANLIGQTRESTAKNLKALKELEIIEYTGSTYFVDKVKLEQYLGEDSFRSLEL